MQASSPRKLTVFYGRGKERKAETLGWLLFVVGLGVSEEIPEI